MKSAAMPWITILLFFVFFSCNTGPGERARNTLGKPENETTGSNPVGWLPPGTNVEPGEGTFHFKSPEGWSYIGYNRSGKVLYGYQNCSTSLSCSCNNVITDKIDPVSEDAGIVVRCKGTDCSGHQLLELKDQSLLIFQGGYFKPTAPLRILKPGEKVPGIFDALFMWYEPFTEQLSRFLAKAHYGYPMALPIKNPDGSITAPGGYSLVTISIMGRGLVTIIPEDVAKAQRVYHKITKVVCVCSPGTCALKTRNILGTAVMWCDGNCNSPCSLTAVGEDKSKAIRIYSYNF